MPLHTLDSHNLKALLDERHNRYNHPDFIATDPISIPHSYSKPADREIAALLAATLAWGQRPTILRAAANLLARMDNSPHDFVMHCSAQELDALDGFVHRTFQATDAKSFVWGLRHIAHTYGGLEALFTQATQQTGDIWAGIAAYHHAMTTAPGYAPRSVKHVPNVQKGSAAKRINMFLRWMVRQDKRGVDFGLWRGISPALLMLPLDLHAGRVARSLGLLTRKQNDRKAVTAVSECLRTLCPEDPIKYDFALYGLGVFEGFV